MAGVKSGVDHGGDGDTGAWFVLCAINGAGLTKIKQKPRSLNFTTL